MPKSMKEKTKKFLIAMIWFTEAQVFCKKGALRNFVKFAVKRLCQSLFLNQVAGYLFYRTPLAAASEFREKVKSDVFQEGKYST